MTTIQAVYRRESPARCASRRGENANRHLQPQSSGTSPRHVPPRAPSPNQSRTARLFLRHDVGESVGAHELDEVIYHFRVRFPSAGQVHLVEVGRQVVDAQADNILESRNQEGIAKERHLVFTRSYQRTHSDLVCILTTQIHAVQRQKLRDRRIGRRRRAVGKHFLAAKLRKVDALSLRKGGCPYEHPKQAAATIPIHG